MEKSKAVVTNVQAPPPGPLGRAELYALSIGNVIGVGIITLVGPAIGMTGYSVWLSYLLAVIFGFVLILPVLFVTSALRLGGGYYSVLTALVGTKVAGMYSFAFLTQVIVIALYGAGFGTYAQSLWPGFSAQAAGIIFVTVFYIINLLGISIMAKVQKWMTGILFAVFAMFIVVGIAKLQNPVFDFSGPLFMTNGTSGLLNAMFLLVFSTQSYSMIMVYGSDAKNAKKDIPWAIFLSAPTILVLYCGVAIVGAGVLPIEQVAGKPLTLAAGSILSHPLFLLFIIGGPIMALTTTANSTIASFCYPIAQACKDGWLPRSLAARNKRGAYWKILTLFYIVALIPLILNFTVTTITNNMLLLMSTFSLLYTIGYSRVPKKYPEAWKRSRMHIPNGLYYLICAVSFAGFAAIFIKSASNLTPAIVGVNLGVIVLCVVLGLVRSRSADVRIETAVWDEN